MDENRRGFLKKAGCTALGLGCGFPLLSTGCDALRQVSADAESSASQWAMIVDVRKCLNEQVRRACREACNHAHNVPFIPDLEEEVKWIWTAQYEHVFPDQTHAHTNAATREAPVLVLCNHCTKPSCVKVCPTGATWKRKTDGLVMMDMHRCIGCRYCMAACPYGARSFNWRDPREKDKSSGKFRYFKNGLSDYPARSMGVVEKCTFCAERIRAGGKDPMPACVEAASKVPDGKAALTFGDLSDPDSEVSRILRQQHTICRRVSLGTGPNVFYII